MKIIRDCLVVVFVLGSLSFNTFSQVSSQCQPQEISAAVYNFVPEDRLQATDFRPLMSTETAFVEKLRDARDIDITDLTTKLLPPDIMPDAPHITGEMVPPPTQLPDAYFFTGQITKTGSGFLLDVQMKKSSDSSLVNDVKTPFPDAAGAEAAGNTTAAAMLAFLSSQAQTAKSDRETGDHAIDPHIDLTVDKQQLKPNERANVKITLSDCDGIRLKHRTIEAYAQFVQGGNTVQEDTRSKLTDDMGEAKGVLGAGSPGVITYIAKFKYKDGTGALHERTDSRSIVISAGGEGDLWQMSVTWQYRERDRFLGKDLQAHRTDISSNLIERKGDLLFLFKVPASPDGTVFTNEIKSFNGFGEATYRHKEMDYDNGLTVSYAHGTFDQSPAASESMQAGFSIDPGNKTFQFNLNNIMFRGQRESLGCSERNGCRTSHDEYVVGADGADKLGGEMTITPEMIRSGVYTFRFDRAELLPVSHTRNAISDQTNEGSNVFNRVEIKVSRVSTNGKAFIR